MSMQVEPTPFSRPDRIRRFELFDSISIWTLALAGAVAIVYGGAVVFRYTVQFLLLFLGTLLVSAGCLAARALARRGRLDLAIYLLLTVLLLGMSSSALLLEGIVLIGGTFYVVVVMMAGILIGFQASFVVAALAAILYFVLAVLSRQPFIAALALGQDLSIGLTWFINCITFLFVAYLGWLTTRDLRRALRDATYDLVKANEELHEANRLKTRFLARVSHELRTPLNSIIGYTDMNLAGFYGELNAAQRDGLERVQRNSHQLLALINDVLDLTRIEAEELDLQERVFNPKGLVLSVAITVEPRAQEKGLTLSHSVDSRLPEALLGDEVRLTQVLLNLLDNSVKFTSKGSIHISAETGEEGTWTLEVRDTGRGISEREMPYIFEEFRQGEDAYRQEVGGAGLGLAICQGLVEAMGGSISVQSRFGAGSTFTVTLPMKLAAQSEEVTTP